jgi:sugar/nucleoside kinase (ribokinase family)
MMQARVITAGEILVEFVSLETGCALSKQTEFAGPYPSGAPAIFIDQVARVGGNAVILGGVGTDGFGKMVCERLRSDGVDVAGIQRIADRSTGVAFVSYFRDGARTFIFHIDNTAADSFEIDDNGTLANKDEARMYVHVSGSSLCIARIRANVMALVEHALEAGWEITFDPNVRKELFADEDVRAAVDSVLSAASIVMPSREDLDFLLPGKTEHEAIDALLDAGAKIVALKRDERGCIVADGTTRLELPGHKVDLVDPTGAGDCFCGTFVGLLAKGHPLAEAARYANAAGALSVTQRGPMEGNRRLDEIRRYLETIEGNRALSARGS